MQLPAGHQLPVSQTGSGAAVWLLALLPSSLLSCALVLPGVAAVVPLW